MPISAVIHGQHSPETLRDPRGFATKFYTSEGNWDLVGNNLPVFFIRDAIKFPDMVHSLKPSPDTNLQDPNRFFDFFSHQPEATHMLTRLYSDYGIPKGYQYMDGNSVHAWKLVNAQGKYVYVKFHWASRQGQHNLTMQQAAAIQAKDFNHASRELMDAIKHKRYPQWDLYIQVMQPEDMAKLDYNPLDATKIWTGVPERKIGTMTLNRNPPISSRKPSKAPLRRPTWCRASSLRKTACCKAESSPMPTPSCIAWGPMASNCRSTARTLPWITIIRMVP
jgi:catalase